MQGNPVRDSWGDSVPQCHNVCPPVCVYGTLLSVGCCHEIESQPEFHIQCPNFQSQLLVSTFSSNSFLVLEFPFSISSFQIPVKFTSNSQVQKVIHFTNPVILPKVGHARKSRARLMERQRTSGQECVPTGLCLWYAVICWLLSWNQVTIHEGQAMST